MEIYIYRQKFIQSPSRLILSSLTPFPVHLRIYVALIKWRSVCKVARENL